MIPIEIKVPGFMIDAVCIIMILSRCALDQYFQE